MFNSIINIGVKANLSNDVNRQIRLTNIVILILILLAFALLIPFVLEDGWDISSQVTTASILFFILLFGFNYVGLNKYSRVIVVIYPPFVTMAATIAIKYFQPNQVAIFDFMDARIIIISFLLLSFMLFSTKEKGLLFSTLGFSFIIIIAFDPIHDVFGVGYARFFGPLPKEYITTGIYIDYAIFFLAASFYYFKNNIEGLLEKNLSLNDDLGEKNIELSALFEELEGANANLTNQVAIKTTELRKSNKELISHNNDLQQFSNTLSHNLRGPVANLLGLAQLFKVDKDEESRTQVAKHIYKSATTLDDVIKDLNKVVDLRNNLHHIKEKISIKKEIEDIWFALDQNVKQCNGKLILDIKIPDLYGIRSYFNSVAYNLISNAIKYRHNDRDCIVRISAEIINNKCLIRITDNGIGIDLVKYEDKLFGMYKRFHDHVDGKGLGLFLAKQQIEVMGGKISVTSQLNIGTQFTIELPAFPLAQIKSQLFFESDAANIYFDAANKIITLLWKFLPPIAAFREEVLQNIQGINAYKAEAWIIDLSPITTYSEREKKEILNNAIDQYIKIGIKKAVIVRKLRKKDVPFWSELYLLIHSKSIPFEFAENIEEAKEKLINM